MEEQKDSEQLRRITFYGGTYSKTDEYAKVTLRKSKYGGVDIFVNGCELPAVMRCSVKLTHPFPSITAEIVMEELTWDAGITVDGLNDGHDDRYECDQGQKNIDPGFPWNRLPKKIKARFCKRKLV